MIEKFSMPQLGESLTEGTVVKWLVSLGEQISVDQPLVEISTDKVDTEIPSPFSGKVLEIFAKEGETVLVGKELITVETAPSAVRPVVGEEPPVIKVTSVAEGVKQPGEIKIKVVASETRAEREVIGREHLSEMEEGPVWQSPAVSRMIKKYHIDPLTIKGTGIGGRITKKDIESLIGEDRPTPIAAAVEEPEKPVVLSSSDGRYKYTLKPGDRFEQFSSIRKKIAEHMVYSKATSPHVSTVAEVDMTKIVKLRQEIKERFREEFGLNLTYMPIISYAVIQALVKYPQVNASVMDDGIVLKKDINLSVAVDTPFGLMVPVIKDALNLSIAAIAQKIDSLAKAAVEKRLKPDDIAGGTFTITNPGKTGNLFGTPVINQPQVGIIRIGEIVKRPVVLEVGGEDVIAVRNMSYCTLSYDHRIIDGLYANNFLHYIKILLEQADFTDLDYS